MYSPTSILRELVENDLKPNFGDAKLFLETTTADFAIFTEKLVLEFLY